MACVAMRMNRKASLAVFNGVRFAPAILIAFFFAGISTAFAEDTNLAQEVRELREQNALLKQQLQKQGESLDVLSKKVEQLETAKENSPAENSEAKKNGFNLGK